MPDRIRRAALVLLVLGAGCHTWSAQSAPPAAVVARAGAGPVRVTRTDHSVVELRNVSVAQDSLIGAATDGSNARVAIPLADVQGVATREVSAGRTAGLSFGVVLALIAALGIVTAIALAQVWGSAG